MIDIRKLESELWEAADDLRANRNSFSVGYRKVTCRFDSVSNGVTEIQQLPFATIMFIRCNNISF